MPYHSRAHIYWFKLACAESARSGCHPRLKIGHCICFLTGFCFTNRSAVALKVFKWCFDLLGIIAPYLQPHYSAQRELMNKDDHASRSARRLLIALTGVLMLSIPGAPFFSRHDHPVLGALLYLLFSPVCHQISHRSFVLSGMPWAVCQRCAGIYLGLFAGSFLPERFWATSLSVKRRRLWTILAAAPLMIDALGPYSGFWTNTPASRFATGLLFGVMVMMLLLPGATELLRTLRVRNDPCAQPTQIQGGVS